MPVIGQEGMVRLLRFSERGTGAGEQCLSRLPDDGPLIREQVVLMIGRHTTDRPEEPLRNKQKQPGHSPTLLPVGEAVPLSRILKPRRKRCHGSPQTPRATNAD